MEEPMQKAFEKRLKDRADKEAKAEPAIKGLPDIKEQTAIRGLPKPEK